MGRDIAWNHNKSQLRIYLRLRYVYLAGTGMCMIFFLCFQRSGTFLARSRRRCSPAPTPGSYTSLTSTRKAGSQFFGNLFSISLVVKNLQCFDFSFVLPRAFSYRVYSLYSQLTLCTERTGTCLFNVISTDVGAIYLQLLKRKFSYLARKENVPISQAFLTFKTACPCYLLIIFCEINKS